MKIKLIDPLNNEKVFESKSAAARFLKVNESSVRKAIRRGKPCQGYYCVVVGLEPKVAEAKVNTAIDWLQLNEDKFIKALESMEFQTITSSIDAKDIWGVNFEKAANKPVDSVTHHLIIPDIHIPYANFTILEKLVELTKDNRFDGIHFLGDYLDMTALSSHDFMKVSNGMKLSDEYEIGNIWLDKLLQYIPKESIKTYIAGNHDFRYQKYLKGVEASKLGSALLSPTVALKLIERGFKVVEDYPDGYVQLGDLQLIHGIYLNANHPKTHINKLHSSCIYGHTHQQLTYSENGWTAYNIGHLADADAPIFRYTNRFEKVNWKHGFAVVTLYKGNTYVQQIEVKDNSFIYNGIVY